MLIAVKMMFDLTAANTKYASKINLQYKLFYPVTITRQNLTDSSNEYMYCQKSKSFKFKNFYTFDNTKEQIILTKRTTTTKTVAISVIKIFLIEIKFLDSFRNMCNQEDSSQREVCLHERFVSTDQELNFFRYIKSLMLSNNSNKTGK